MGLGKLPMPGRPWVIVKQGPLALAVGGGGGCYDISTLQPTKQPTYVTCECNQAEVF